MKSKFKKGFALLIVPLLVAAYLVSISKAATSANYTNNGAATATFGPSKTDGLVLDITLPNAWNGFSEAIKKYQQARKINAVGQMGEITREAILNESLGGRKAGATFKPNQRITRSEALKIVYEVSKFKRPATE